MTDNIQVKDANGTLRTMKTTEVDGVHTAHHVVDNRVDVNIDQALHLGFDNKLVSETIDATHGPLPVKMMGTVQLQGTSSVTVAGGSLTLDNPYDGKLKVDVDGVAFGVGYGAGKKSLPVQLTASDVPLNVVLDSVNSDAVIGVNGTVSISTTDGPVGTGNASIPVKLTGSNSVAVSSLPAVTIDSSTPVAVTTTFPSTQNVRITASDIELGGAGSSGPVELAAGTNLIGQVELAPSALMKGASKTLALVANPALGLNTPLYDFGFVGTEDIQVYIGSVGHVIHVVEEGAVGVNVNITDTINTLIARINEIEAGLLTVGYDAGNSTNYNLLLSCPHDASVMLNGDVDKFGWTPGVTVEPTSIIPTVDVSGAFVFDDSTVLNVNIKSSDITLGSGGGSGGTFNGDVTIKAVDEFAYYAAASSTRFAPVTPTQTLGDLVASGVSLPTQLQIGPIDGVFFGATTLTFEDPTTTIQAVFDAINAAHPGMITNVAAVDGGLNYTLTGQRQWQNTAFAGPLASPLNLPTDSFTALTRKPVVPSAPLTIQDSFGNTRNVSESHPVPVMLTPNPNQPTIPVSFDGSQTLQVALSGSYVQKVAIQTYDPMYGQRDVSEAMPLPTRLMAAASDGMGGLNAEQPVNGNNPLPVTLPSNFKFSSRTFVSSYRSIGVAATALETPLSEFGIVDGDQFAIGGTDFINNWGLTPESTLNNLRDALMSWNIQFNIDNDHLTLGSDYTQHTFSGAAATKLGLAGTLKGVSVLPETKLDDSTPIKVEVTNPSSGGSGVSGPVELDISGTKAGSATTPLNITGSVDANVIFPETQQVSGSVTATISGTPTVNANVTFPSTQAVSGNVTAAISGAVALDNKGSTDVAQAIPVNIVAGGSAGGSSFSGQLTQGGSNVSATNALPVAFPGQQVWTEWTAIPASNTTLTGPARATPAQVGLQFVVKIWSNNGSEQIFIDFSLDGSTNWRQIASYTTGSGTNQYYSLAVDAFAPYYRVRYYHGFFTGATVTIMSGFLNNSVENQVAISSLPSVNLTGMAAVYNDTTTNLAAGATFTGSSRISLSNSAYTTFSATAYADKDGILRIEQSTNNTNWYRASNDVALVGGATATVTATVTCTYMRVVYVNGSSAQTSFMLNSIATKN